MILFICIYVSCVRIRVVGWNTCVGIYVSYVWIRVVGISVSYVGLLLVDIYVPCFFDNICVLVQLW